MKVKRIRKRPKINRELSNTMSSLKDKGSFNGDKYTIIPEYIRRCLLLSDGAIRVFEELLSWTKGDSSCWIPQWQIQADLNMSNVGSHIKELREKGFIKTTDRSGERLSTIFNIKGQVKNSYVLLSEAIHTMRENLFEEFNRGISCSVEKTKTKQKEALITRILKLTKKKSHKDILNGFIDELNESKKTYELAYELVLTYFCNELKINKDELQEDTKKPVYRARKQVSNTIQVI